jgi:hypothetical protein
VVVRRDGVVLGDDEHISPLAVSSVESRTTSPWLANEIKHKASPLALNGVLAPAVPTAFPPSRSIFFGKITLSILVLTVCGVVRSFPYHFHLLPSFLPPYSLYLHSFVDGRLHVFLSFSLLSSLVLYVALPRPTYDRDRTDQQPTKQSSPHDKKLVDRTQLIIGTGLVLPEEKYLGNEQVYRPQRMARTNCSVALESLVQKEKM